MKTIHVCFFASMLAATLNAADTRPLRPATGNAAQKTSPGAPSTNAIPLSLFVIPQNPQEGRDPFFPRSTRLTPKIDTSKPAAPAEANVALLLQGISGASNNPLAIINGRTFAENEEADMTVGGVQVRIRCLQIGTDFVVIEAANVRRTLRLRSMN